MVGTCNQSTGSVQSRDSDGGARRRELVSVVAPCFHRHLIVENVILFIRKKHEKHI